MLALIVALLPSIALAVTPSACLEPCSIKASITVENYDPDREVCLAIYSTVDEEPERRSCFPFSGRKVTAITISNIPAGNYSVIASLGIDGKRATKSLLVSGGEMSIRKEKK